MIAFVTSLRHPDNADDYARVEELLHESLASVTAAGESDRVVIVVANRPPRRPLPDGVILQLVDFAAPPAASGPHADRDAFVRDKGSKIGVGLLVARDYAPSHVMIFDADDFVHRDVPGFVAARPDHQGWVIDRGWMYSRVRGAARPIERLHRTCGTSYIIPFDAYRVPEDLALDASQDEVVAAYGEVLPNILGAHRNAVAWHAEDGRILEPLPFRGAVYQVDTGENHSGKSLSGVARPLPASVAADFAIVPAHPRLLVRWRSAGPRAVIETVRADGAEWRRATAHRAADALRGAARGVRNLLRVPLRIIRLARRVVRGLLRRVRARLG